MIVGTAGHVDHGKSTLVSALTGRAVDRLAEERRRGMTIDLGFAALELPDGRLAGVVDVPGHEDFVRTMVAGASGADVALLVIAADEGVMPQTEEHLVILEQLGVSRGIPVVTKIDLVDDEWLGLVVSDVGARVATSSVAFDQPWPVSARTGAGIGSLRSELCRVLGELPPRSTSDLFRLPIDRAFSRDGVGTVVTGTCWSGSVEIGSEVRLVPEGAPLRVRSLESHGRPLSAALPGARIAVGLVGVERKRVRRGMSLVSADVSWPPTTRLDVVLAIHGRARPIARRTRVRLHLGTEDVMGWAVPRAPIGPGEQGLARLSLDHAIVARGGDRLVLRLPSPVATIGGGVVVDPAPERRAPWPEALRSPDRAARLTALAERRRDGLHVALAPVISGLSRRELQEVVRATPALRRVGEHLVGAAALDSTMRALMQALRAHHDGRPAERGFPLETFRRSVGAAPWLTEAALAALRAGGAIAIQDGIVAEPTHRPRVTGGDAVLTAVVGLVEGAGLTPPTVAELAAATGRPDIAAILRIAAAGGGIVAVERERYFSRMALQNFAAAVRELAAEGDVSVGALRQRLGISRKYLIPLLEWADRTGLTVRAGDSRRLGVAPSGAVEPR